MVSVYYFGNDPFVYRNDITPNVFEQAGNYLTKPVQDLHRRFYPLSVAPDLENPSKYSDHHPYQFIACYICSIVLPILDLLGCLFRAIGMIGKETRPNQAYLVERYQAKWKVDAACRRVELAHAENDISKDPFFDNKVEFKDSTVKSKFKMNSEIQRLCALFTSRLEQYGKDATTLTQALSAWTGLSEAYRKIAVKKTLNAQEIQDYYVEVRKDFINALGVSEFSDQLKKDNPAAWETSLTKPSMILKALGEAMKKASTEVIAIDQEEYTRENDALQKLEDLLMKV